jgi:exodeoxyribonuclease V beta subunit
VRGFLKGFIDLIFEFQGRFYLADWKSNFLGDDYADYMPECLRQAMFKSCYTLQYLIYTVALDKYLQKQIKNYSYEKYFGGVYYFFLRRINSRAAENNGVYFDRPSELLLHQLQKTF